LPAGSARGIGGGAIERDDAVVDVRSGDAVAAAGILRRARSLVDAG
jgi:hypothetical protein